MIVNITEETAEQIEKNLKIVKQSVDNIKNLVHISYFNFNEMESEERLKNPYIVKTVLKHLATGLNETDAILLTAQEYETSFERVKTVYNPQKKFRSAIQLFAKRYLCVKLRQAGFTAKDIALVLNVSENHIFKLLNCNIDYWSPKTKIKLKRKKQ